MERTSLETPVRYLMDRAEITDVMGRYALGMDLRNWDLYRSCWTESVTFDVDDFGFEEGPFRDLGLDDWILALQAFFEDIKHSQHVKYPVSFQFDGDRAEVYAIMQGKHWMPTNTGDALQTVVGYYRDVYVRTPQGWKMSRSKEILHWNEGNYAVIDVNMKKLFKVLSDIRRRKDGFSQ